MTEKAPGDLGPPPAAELRHKAEARLRANKAALAAATTEPGARALVHELQVRQIELEMQNEELHRARAEAEEALEKYADLFDFAPVGYFLWDRQGQILELNLAGAALLGLERGAASRKRFGPFVAPECRSAFADFLKRVLANDARQTCEVTLLAGDASLPVLVEGIATADRQGRLRLCRAAVIDITQQKRADELAAATKALEEEIVARKQAEEEIRSLAEFPQENPNPILRVFGDGAVLYANQPAIRVLKAMGWRAGQGLPEELLRPARRAMEAGETLEFDLLCPAGRTFSFAATPSSRAGQVNLYAHDITDRKQAESALQTTLQRFYVVLSSMYCGVLLVTDEGQVEFANQALCDSFGLEDTPADLMGLGRRDMIEKIKHAYLQPDEAVARIREVVDRGQPVRGEELAMQDGRTCLRDFVPLNVQGKSCGRLWLHFDITASKQAEEALRESEERHQLATSIAKEAIWEVNLKTGAARWNRAYTELFGRPAEATAHGPWWLSRIHPDDRGRVDASFAKALAEGGESWTCDYRMKLADDSYAFLNDRAIIVRDKAGSPVRAVGAKLNITDRKRAEEALVQAKTAAEAANVAKSRFLANISHELRTPMNAILGMVDLALQKQVNPPAKDFLQTAKQSADLLLVLLNDLLDSAKIEAGKLELESAPFSLRDVLDRTTAALTVRAGERGIAFSCTVAPDVPDALVGDQIRLRQVLLNLAGNAIKFTDRGEVAVRIRTINNLPSPDQPSVGARRGAGGEGVVQLAQRPHPAPLPEGEGTTTLEFAVRDTGIGIPPAELDRIFHPFAQADASTTRTFGGTGLGLTISANLVGLMGGRMWVESEVGKGSTFFFTARFPLAKEAPPRSKPALDVSAAPPASLRVLVVEDNPANQKLAAYILQDRGHRVEIAADGQQALSMTSDATYDVILMDVQMPGMDGTEATAAIRAREAGRRRVPIIAMTAHAMKRDRERCMAAGMDGYLSKPIAGQDLIEAVERCGGKAVPPAAEAVLCLEEALARLDGRRELFQEMVAFFFQDTPAVLEGIRAGLQDGSAAALDRHAHKLMGTLLYLGAEPALKAAQRVETIGRLGNLTEAAEAVSHLERELSRLEEALVPHYPAGREEESDRPSGG